MPSTTNLFDVLSGALAPIVDRVELEPVQGHVKRDDDGTTRIFIGLPGVPADRLSLVADQDKLTVEVDKAEGEESKLLWFEGFSRRIPLPKGTDLTAVTAHLVDGLLTITLPLSKEKKSRKIEVS